MAQEALEHRFECSWMNATPRLSSDTWIMRQFPRNGTTTELALGPVLQPLAPEAFWLGSSLEPANWLPLPAMCTQASESLTILPPYLPFVDASQQKVASAPTDFRKDISVMGADATGFTVPAAQRLGSLLLRHSTTDQSMATLYRKLLGNLACAELVCKATPEAGGTTGPDGVDGAGLRYWRDLAADPLGEVFVVAQNYQVGAGRPNLAPAAAPGGPVICGLSAGIIEWLYYGTLPANWPAAAGGRPAYPAFNGRPPSESDVLVLNLTGQTWYDDELTALIHMIGQPTFIYGLGHHNAAMGVHRPNLCLNDDLQYVPRCVVILGIELPADCGHQCIAYPSLATMRSVILKILTSHGATEAFATAYFQTAGAMLGFDSLERFWVLAGGAGVPVTAVVPADTIPAGRRCTMTGRWETKVWAQPESIGNAFIPLSDITATAAAGIFQDLVNLPFNQLLSFLHKRICSAALAFQTFYRKNLVGANLVQPGPLTPPPGTLGSVRDSTLSTVQMIDKPDSRLLCGIYRVIVTIIHILALVYAVKQEKYAEMLAGLDYLSRTAADSRGWPARLGRSSPVAYIRSYVVFDKDTIQGRMSMATWATISDCAKALALVLNAALELGGALDLVDANATYVYEPSEDACDAKLLNNLRVLLAVYQGVLAKAGRVAALRHMLVRITAQKIHGGMINVGALTGDIIVRCLPNGFADLEVLPLFSADSMERFHYSVANTANQLDLVQDMCSVRAGVGGANVGGIASGVVAFIGPEKAGEVTGVTAGQAQAKVFDALATALGVKADTKDVTSRPPTPPLPEVEPTPPADKGSLNQGGLGGGTN